MPGQNLTRLEAAERSATVRTQSYDVVLDLTRGETVFGSTIEIARMVILIVAVILFFVTLLGSVPAIRYLMALKPTEVLHGK